MICVTEDPHIVGTRGHLTNMFIRPPTHLGLSRYLRVASGDRRLPDVALSIEVRCETVYNYLQVC